MFFCFRALSTQQGGYVRATNLYYYYYYYVFFFVSAPWAPSRVDMCALQIVIITIIIIKSITYMKCATRVLT